MDDEEMALALRYLHRRGLVVYPAGTGDLSAKLPIRGRSKGASDKVKMRVQTSAGQSPLHLASRIECKDIARIIFESASSDILSSPTRDDLQRYECTTSLSVFLRSVGQAGNCLRSSTSPPYIRTLEGCQKSERRISRLADSRIIPPL